eukprot:1844896-Amphidinium_carterae.1
MLLVVFERIGIRPTPSALNALWTVQLQKSVPAGPPMSMRILSDVHPAKTSSCQSCPVGRVERLWIPQQPKLALLTQDRSCMVSPNWRSEGMRTSSSKIA